VLWRISFSAAEKDIILRADGMAKATEEKTNRKAVLRLLKDDIEKFNRHRADDEKLLCSFHAKTVFLHCLEEIPRDDDWQDIRRCYVAALNMFVDFLTKGRMPHYFVNGVNLIDRTRMTSVQRDQLRQAIEHFTSIINENDS
jgi:hypothetical protein